MSQNVICPECGKETAMAATRCRLCGAKLYDREDGKKPRPAGKERRRKEPGIFGKFFILIRFLVMLALLAVLLLIIWPPSEPEVAKPADTGNLDRISSQLRNTLSFGAPTIMAKLSGEECNYYLDQRLSERRKQADDGVKWIEWVHAELQDGSIQAEFSTQIGPLSISRSFTYALDIVDGKAVLNLQAAKLGLLPVPGKAAEILEEKSRAVMIEVLGFQPSTVNQLKFAEDQLTISFGKL